MSDEERLERMDKDLDEFINGLENPNPKKRWLSFYDSDNNAKKVVKTTTVKDNGNKSEQTEDSNKETSSSEESSDSSDDGSDGGKRDSDNNAEKVVKTTTVKDNGNKSEQTEDSNKETSSSEESSDSSDDGSDGGKRDSDNNAEKVVKTTTDATKATSSPPTPTFGQILNAIGVNAGGQNQKKQKQIVAKKRTPGGMVRNQLYKSNVTNSSTDATKATPSPPTPTFGRILDAKMSVEPLASVQNKVRGSNATRARNQRRTQNKRKKKIGAAVQVAIQPMDSRELAIRKEIIDTLCVEFGGEYTPSHPGIFDFNPPSSTTTQYRPTIRSRHDTITEKWEEKIAKLQPIKGMQPVFVKEQKVNFEKLRLMQEAKSADDLKKKFKKN